MGSELVGDSLPQGYKGVEQSTPSISYTEIFYKHLPYYLAIGMPYKEFWDGDCYLTKVYREADDIKKQRKNEELWLQGMYIYEVLLDVAPRYDQLAKPHQRKPNEYSKEPYAITQKQVRQKKEREEKLKFDTMLAKMRAFASVTNEKFANNIGKEDKTNAK